MKTETSKSVTLKVISYGFLASKSSSSRIGPVRNSFLNPQCRYALTSSLYLWPLAIPVDDHKELQDPVVGLIPPDNLPLAFCAVDAKRCELLFMRLIGILSIRNWESGRGDINMITPAGFEFCGFEVTNGWYGASPISTDGHDPEEWKELRSLANGHVNEWNLLTDFKVAHELAMLFSDRDPVHGPFRVVLFATATLETRVRIAAGTETIGT